MAAFYYGSCPAEGLLWRCESDGRNIEICPFGKARTDKSTEETWAMIEDSGGYGGEWRDRILQATVDLQVTSISVYGESGAVVPDPISSTSFRRFIKMLREGVPVAEYYLPDGTGRFLLDELTEGQRIRKFLNSAVPYIWEYAQRRVCIKKNTIPREPDKKKIYSVNRDDISKALKKDHVPKVTYPSEKISAVRLENKESTDSAFKFTVKKDDLDALVSSYNYLQSAEITRTNDPVNHPSHYQLHGGMEVIDIIEAITWDLPSDEAYAIGNAIKYICRYRNKGKPVQDLEKAKWYLNRAIEDYKKGEEGN